MRIMYDYVTRKAPKGCTFCRKHPAFSQGEALELNNSGSQEATFAQSFRMAILKIKPTDRKRHGPPQQSRLAELKNWICYETWTSMDPQIHPNSRCCKDSS